MQVVSSLFSKGGSKGKGKGKGKDRSRLTLKKIESDRKVWVGGLPKGLTWQDLEKHFAEHATKPKVTEVMAYGKRQCAFKDAEEATAAIAAVNGTEIKGK